MSYPDYSFSDELPAPSDLGIRRKASFNALFDSITGVNFYIDSIGFGEPTGLSKLRGGAFIQNQRPMGLQFFMNTGLQCSNGAPMYEYISTIPKGDALGKNVQSFLTSASLPAMRGLAPGILEDVKDSLNPERMFSIFSDDSKSHENSELSKSLKSVSKFTNMIPNIPRSKNKDKKDSGKKEDSDLTNALQQVAGMVSNVQNSKAFPKCKKVRMTVGDGKGRIQSAYNPSNVWIEGQVDTVNGQPTQERWVFDSWITKDEWDKVPKTEAPAIPKKKGKAQLPEMTCESFETMESSLNRSHLYATILLGALSVGIIYYKTFTK